jgi:hypothetical protein
MGGGFRKRGTPLSDCRGFSLKSVWDTFHFLQNERIGLVRSKQAKTEPKMTKAYNRRLPLGKNAFLSETSRFKAENTMYWKGKEVSNSHTIAADSCSREIQRRTGSAMGNSRKQGPCCICTTYR